MKRHLRMGLAFLAIAVAYTVFLLGRDLLTGEDLEPGRVLATAGVGLFVAAGAFGVVRWQAARERKKPLGYPTATRFRAAVSSGRLPRDADFGQWHRELTKIIRQERQFLWIGPLMFSAFAALGIFLVADNPSHPWFWVIATAVLAGLAIWTPISVLRRQRQMEALISQLSSQAEENGPAL